MSTAIDQRVVEMRFDNKQFESNVSTTMSTLDKLKQKLNLTGAAKGIENVGNAAKGFNLSGMGGAIEAVQAKFSALQVIGITALANITNSAINTGKRMVSALTIDPIKTGLQEYETQINAVQTILANTESKGTTLGQVNAALDTLNKYADKTIYNFTEMTRNIGTFTAAGVDLETSVNAIQGIANLAAVSGSSSQQASTAMYQLSQALASGTVKLMDWNSVVNAGMGGQVFQDALKETARVHGVNIDQMIEKEGSFRETLQKGWLTSDILTETLSHFTMAAEEGSKQWEAYKKTLMDDGYSEEQANAILKLSNTATDAATKVKTATQLWDTLKETAQSGWTQTWETILGDFGEAKELFSGIYETLSPILEATAEARNTLLSGGLSSGWKQFLNKGIPDEEGYRDSIKNVAKDHGIAIDDMIEAEKKLNASLSDNDAFQKVLKQGLQDGSITSDMLSESVTKLADKMRNMTDAEREAAGYTEEHIAQIEKLEAGLKDGSISMEEFTEKMLKPSGRENIIEGLKNAFDGLMNVIKPVKDAFRDIFPPMTSDQIYGFTENFKNLTVTFKEFGTKYADQIERTFKGIFSVIDIGKKIFTAFTNSILELTGSDGVASLGEFILNTAASIGDFFTSLNDRFNVESVSDIFSSIGSAISTGLSKGVDFIHNFSDVLSKAGDVICKAASVIWEGIETIASSIWGGLKQAFTWISDNFSAGDIFAGLAGGGIFVLARKLSKFVDNIKDSIQGLLGKKDGGGSIKEKLSELLGGVSEVLQSFTTGIKVGSFVAIAASIAILASAFGKISELDAEGITKSLITMGTSLAIMTTAVNAMSSGSNFVKSGISLMLMAKAMTILADAIAELSGLSLEDLGKGLVGVASGIAALCVGLKILSGTKLSLGTSIAMLALAEACKILGDAMHKFVGFSWDEIGRGLAAMGGALGELVISLSVLSKVGGFGSLLGSLGILIATQSLSEMAEALKSFGEMNWDEIGRGLAAMGGALAEVSIATGGLGALAGFSSIFASGAILITVQGLSEMAEALKSFGEMSWDEIGRGLSAMGGALAEVGTVTGTLGALTGFSSIFASGAILIVTQGLSDIADALSEFGIMTWDEIGRGLAAMGGALAELTYTLTTVGTIAGFSSIFASGSLLIVTQGLSDIASSLKEFGEMSWSEVGRGLTAMGGALGELALTLGILGTLAGFSSIFASGALLITIQGLGDLADSLKSFGEMSWSEIGRGLTAMGGALAEVAVVTGVLGTLAGLPALLGGGAILLAVQGLGDLADALQKFGEMSWDEIGRGLTAMAGALSEVALGGLLSTFSGIGASAISDMAAPLGTLADSVKKWSGVTVPEGLGTNLATLASGVMEFTFDGLGASALASAAPAIGTLADSVKKWSGVTVPEGLGDNLASLAPGIKAFTLGGLGAGALSEAATGVGTMADSIKKWSDVVIPESLGTSLESLGAGVKAFTFGGNGAGAISEAAPALNLMADSVTKWVGLTIPEDLTTKLEALATGVKAFTFGGLGAGALSEAAPALASMADTIVKWSGVIIPDELSAKLESLASGVKAFTFGGGGADTMSVAASGLGTMADSVKKWSGVTVPEELGSSLSTLADGVKKFTFGGSGAETLNIAASGLDTLSSAIKKMSSTTIPDGLSEKISGLVTACKGFSGILGLPLVASGMNQIATASANLAGVNYGSISSGLSSLSTAISDFSSVGSSIAGIGAAIVNELVTPIQNGSAIMSSAGQNLGSALANGLKSKQSQTKAIASAMITEVVNAIKTKATTIKSEGEKLGSTFAAGISSKKSEAKSAGTGLATDATNGAKDGGSGMRGAGVDLGNGLVAGINSMVTAAYNAGFALGQAAVQGEKDGQASASPSKETIKAGKWLGEGLVIGMQRMSRAVYNAGNTMGEDAVGSISTSINRISDMVSSDIDAQPTIRPILDLSDIRSGAASIGNMFDIDSSVGVLANVNGINTMMSRRGQNGANSEVVSAIDKLRKDIGNIQGNSYSIGGVSYDDGSAVGNAVNELVRAMRVEGRI